MKRILVVLFIVGSCTLTIYLIHSYRMIGIVF